MLNKFLFTLLGLFFANTAFANDVPTLGSITAQRGVLEDLNLQVQIQEQSQKLNQLLMPIIQPQQSELTAKQLMDKLEVPDKDLKDLTDVKKSSGEDNRSTKVIAIYSNSKELKAKIKYKGKTAIVSNGKDWNGQKVQIFRDRVIIGNQTLDL